MTEKGADDELASRLDVALHDRLDDTSVDVGALAAGGRRRARRLRSQRLGAAAAALAVLIAVPAGWQLATAQRPTDMQGAVLLPKQEDRAADEVPDSVAFSLSELPPDSTLTGAAAGASSGSVDPKLVAGLNCVGASGSAATDPDAADNAQQREWRWSSSTNDISLIVTRWADTGAATSALTALATDTSTCTWNDPVEVIAYDVLGADQTWVGSTTSNGESVVRMIVRVNELIAGVQVSGTDEEALTELADSLATSEVDKLRALS